MFKFKVELHHTRMIDAITPEVNPVTLTPKWDLWVELEAWSTRQAIEAVLEALDERTTLFVCNNEIVATCTLMNGPEAGRSWSYTVSGERKVIWTLESP